MRLFVALTLPEQVRTALTRVQQRCKYAPADVSWVPPELFHITMMFLGDMPESALDSISTALTAHVAKTGMVACQCCGTGFFPRPQSPRVLWAGVQSRDGALSQLGARIHTALHPLGFQKEPRPLSPHVTLGRIKSRRGIEPLQERIALFHDADFGSWDAQEVVLMQSILHTEGPEYQCITSVSIL